MTLPPLSFVLAGSVMTIILAGALRLLRRVQAEEARSVRAGALLKPYRNPTVPRRGLLRAFAAWTLDPAPRAARLFGIELKFAGDYPVPWWAVLIGTLAGGYAITFVAALFVSVPQVLLVPAGWIALSRFVFAWFGARRRNLLYRQFPDALSMIVRGLRVGQAVSQALRGVARDAPQPTGGEFVRLADRLAIGASMSEALIEMAQENGVTEYRFFATALLLQSQTGGSLSEALETLADVIKNRLSLRKRAYALASEARTSAIILTVLPIAAGGALALVSPDYARVLVDDPIGRFVLGGAIAMLITGTVVMKWMIRRLLQ